jgi:hypothetical protein
MSNEYRHNHYVPEWYQKRFLPPDRKDRELFYLDRTPGTFTDPHGVKHTRKAVRRLGFKHCFAEDDLYTAKFGPADSTAIEQRPTGISPRHVGRRFRGSACAHFRWQPILLDMR